MDTCQVTEKMGRKEISVDLQVTRRPLGGQTLEEEEIKQGTYSAQNESH